MLLLTGKMIYHVGPRCPILNRREKRRKLLLVPQNVTMSIIIINNLLTIFEQISCINDSIQQDTTFIAFTV